ncbi:MAG: thioredoxin domain-containing protein [Dehalococcoidia bacterium]
MPNRLALETSPYLLQHADNPVDWYPWGHEAFAKARAEDKPILLSVGYSSCHWCHVMAHESFEDASIAGLMNQWYVNVKVDREERPDVDGVYMTAVQAMTGRGGWPMTVFLTPDLRPFYTGTYFPPVGRHGMPGFPQVLEALHTAWVDERAKVLAQAEGITDHLVAAAKRQPPSVGGITLDAARQAIDVFRNLFDRNWGGFGQAPKFPSPSNLEFLLAYEAYFGPADAAAPSAGEMALTTLTRMAQGGIHDHLGGGFARYSVDQYWLVPHFEKMLYDNAQLARAYLHAYQLTGEPFYRHVVDDILGYLLREMRGPEGGFFSAQDADTEGIEGKFFVWTRGEVEAVLGKEDAAVFCEWFGVTGDGNFQDPHHPEFGRRSVLAAWRDPSLVARQFGLDEPGLEAKLSEGRAKLFAERARRVPPGLDDKVLTSWNGLALAAFAEAGRVLGNAGYLATALRCAAFFRSQMWRGGHLLHTYKDGVAKVDGMIEDYAYLGLGLVELYKATGEIVHLQWAAELLEVVIKEFRDPEKGGFFETPHGAESLLFRQKSAYDEATPSGNGAVAQLAFALGRYRGRGDWEAFAEEAIGVAGEQLLQAPNGFGSMWLAALGGLAPREEVVVVGDERGELMQRLAGFFRPWAVIAPGPEGTPLPLFEGRSPGAYVCRDMVCDLPAHTSQQLADQLAALAQATH